MTVPDVPFRLVPRSVPTAPRGAELPVVALSSALPPGDEELVPATVTTRRRGDVLDVVLSGDVDLLLTARLDEVLVEAEAHCRGREHPRVHLDLRAVTALDSSALRFVEQLRRCTARAGGSCSQSTARGAVQRVLALARTVPTGQLAAS